MNTAGSEGDRSEAVRRSMRSNRGRDTGPEVNLRRALFATGLRYRKNRRLDVAGEKVRPDIVFARRRVAVFVDGCFWHGCSLHRSVPASNREFWSDKLAANRERDLRQDLALRAAGWQVVRVWEHERINEAAARVRERLLARGDVGVSV